MPRQRFSPILLFAVAHVTQPCCVISSTNHCLQPLGVYIVAEFRDDEHTSLRIHVFAGTVADASLSGMSSDFKKCLDTDLIKAYYRMGGSRTSSAGRNGGREGAL
eukprot:TRINITY_DN4071_c0_g1_i1.p1 TRINITY_DN4071_c0_g1~~TRINITY_DN4071_c0_g1_i1.p1  ORF type:complete len:105 (-),score=2.25 TRINITY_DN4071_c0_g1_i1:149-463(-)